MSTRGRVGETRKSTIPAVTLGVVLARDSAHDILLLLIGDLKCDKDVQLKVLASCGAAQFCDPHIDTLPAVNETPFYSNEERTLEFIGKNAEIGHHELLIKPAQKRLIKLLSDICVNKLGLRHRNRDE